MLKNQVKCQLNKYRILGYLRNSRIFRLKNKRNYDYFKLNSTSVLSKIVTLFNKNGVVAWPTFGTLLGLIRDGGPIKFDLDIDIGVFYSREIQIKIRNLLIDHGFSLYSEVSHRDEYNLFERYYLDNIPIDIYYFFDHNGAHCTYDLEQDGSMTVEECLNNMSDIKVYRNEFSNFKLGKKVINNIQFNIPVDINNYLIEHYGESYNVPDARWHNNKRKNRYVDKSIELKMKKS